MAERLQKVSKSFTVVNGATDYRVSTNVAGSFGSAGEIFNRIFLQSDQAISFKINSASNAPISVATFFTSDIESISDLYITNASGFDASVTLEMSVSQDIASGRSLGSASGSGGGGGGAITAADGAIVSIGAKADASASTDTGTFSLIALTKRLLTFISSMSSSLVSTVLSAGNNQAQEGDAGQKVTPLPLKTYRSSFAKTLAGAIDTALFAILVTGSGMAIDQVNGNIQIKSGVTANAESIIRSSFTVNDTWIMRLFTAMSQRIINNSTIIEAVDLIGDGLAMSNISTGTLTFVDAGWTRSTTTATVTCPNHGFAVSDTFTTTNSSDTGAILNQVLTYSVVAVTNTNVFTFTCTNGGASQGYVTITTGAKPSVVVTIPSNPFTVSNVNQMVTICKINLGSGGSSPLVVPADYRIGSVSGNDVTFIGLTGYTSGTFGTGQTCSLTGWNYFRLTYDSTTATNAKIDSQRYGYNLSPSTMTISTNAQGTGHMPVFMTDDGEFKLFDSSGTFTTTPSASSYRGGRLQNIPDVAVPLYFQFRVVNGTTAPASSTMTFIGLFMAEIYASMPVQMLNHRYNESSSVIVNSLPTLSTVTTVTTLANGQTAHSSASTGSPLRAGGRVVTALDTTLVTGDASDLLITTGQQLVTKMGATSENDWQYAAAASGIVNTTTAVTIKAAGAASIRNFITGISIMSEALGAATEVAIRDGASGTVIWRIKIGTAGLPLTHIHFPTPLRGSAATLLEVVTLTASVTGAVYFDAQGYQSF